MATDTAPTAAHLHARRDARWTLRGITAEAGVCEHCGRTLARLFKVSDPDGVAMTVGRTCAKTLTGWSWSIGQAEHAERLTQRNAAALAEYGQLYTDLRAQAAHEAHCTAHRVALQCGDAEVGLRDRDLVGAQAVTFARAALASSTEQYGTPADCLRCAELAALPQASRSL